jgi:hypothetical protein
VPPCYDAERFNNGATCVHANSVRLLGDFALETAYLGGSLLRRFLTALVIT